MKICYKCNEEKDEEKFPFKNKKLNVRNSACRTCHSLYVKLHYQKNKERYLKSAQNRRDLGYDSNKELKEYINSKKLSGCFVCKESFPQALDFHHLFGKDRNVSQMTSKKAIDSEIQKCIVLCATCHRKYHYGHVATQELIDKFRYER